MFLASTGTRHATPPPPRAFHQPSCQQQGALSPSHWRFAREEPSSSPPHDGTMMMRSSSEARSSHGGGGDHHGAQNSHHGSHRRHGRHAEGVGTNLLVVAQSSGTPLSCVNIAHSKPPPGLKRLHQQEEGRDGVGTAGSGVSRPPPSIAPQSVMLHATDFCEVTLEFDCRFQQMLIVKRTKIGQVSHQTADGRLDAPTQEIDVLQHPALRAAIAESQGTLIS